MSGSGKPNPLAIVLIGVSGSGKSTVGKLLAPVLGATFVEGDDYHSSSNVAKMRAGIPLDDADRWPWLERLGGVITDLQGEGNPVVTACSALRHAYREALEAAARRALTFIHLSIDPTILEHRLRARRQHFMPPSLLESQLETLEPLRVDEDGTEIFETGTVQRTVEAIERWLSLRERNLLADGYEKGRHRRPFPNEQKPRSHS